MILRSNKKLVDAYLLELINQVSSATIQIKQTHLITLLKFVGEKPLKKAMPVLTGYKRHLLSIDARRDGKKEPLSHSTIRKNLGDIRDFLDWLIDEKDFNFKLRWVKQNFTLTRAESNLANPKPDEDEVFYITLDDVIRIAQTPVSTLLEERTRAACIFLLLTGMRIGAFVTLPIKAIDLETRQVKQWTEFGVKTKLSKSATTPILDIPDHPVFLEIVRTWDVKVRTTLPPNTMWFANLSPVTGELDISPDFGEHRDSGFRNDLRKLFQKTGLAYKSPHKFRHGSIRFLRDQAKSIKDLEAIAKFSMQTVSTMLLYGALGAEDSRTTIDRLCGHSNGILSLPPQIFSGNMAASDKASLINLLETVLAFLKGTN